MSTTAPYFTRLGAAMATALLMGLAIARPDAAKDAFASKGLPRTVYAAKACAVGEPPLAAGFADVDAVAAVAPVGAPWLEGEAPPQPVLKVVGRSGEATARAPARADIVSIRKHTERRDGAAHETWSIALAPCEGYLLRYQGLDRIEPRLLRQAGPLKFAKADDVAVETRIRVKTGDALGRGPGFAVAAFALDPSRLRGREPVAFSKLSLPASASLCPLALIARAERTRWTALFGDARGRRLPAHAETCRAALDETVVAASGRWLTDSGHGGRTNKVANAALTSDPADPDRLVFAFWGRLASLSPDYFDSQSAAARAAAAREAMTAPLGADRVNASFKAVLPGEAYCYEGLRAGVDGPRLKGLLLLRLERNASGEPLLKVEATGAATRCADLEQPWTFSGAETRFYPHLESTAFAAAPSND